MRAVTVIVLRIARVRHEVIAVHVIDVAVAVIVDIIRGDLARICPGVRRQVRMVVGDARVDNDGDGRVASCGDIPCVRKVERKRGVHARILRVVGGCAREKRIVWGTRLVTWNFREHSTDLGFFALVA